MSKLWVSAGIQLTEGADVKETKKALGELRQETLKEAGCIQFDILQQIDHPQYFTLWECWSDEAALQNHFTTPHTKAYLARDLTRVSYIERLQINGTRLQGAA